MNLPVTILMIVFVVSTIMGTFGIAYLAVRFSITGHMPLAVLTVLVGVLALAALVIYLPSTLTNITAVGFLGYGAFLGSMLRLATLRDTTAPTDLNPVA